MRAKTPLRSRTLALSHALTLALSHALTLPLLSGCSLTQDHYIDAQDINLPEPDAAQVSAWRKNEPWRSDPRRVAHEELGRRLEVPWRGQAYTAERYEFVEKSAEHPEWGSFVTRGFTDGQDRVFRYRVKVGCEDGIWYARQLSHFVKATLPHPIFDDGPPPMGK